MSEVKRYEWGDDGMWEFNEQGRYVEASDHDHLISAKDALLAERDAEIGRLKSAMRDAEEHLSHHGILGHTWHAAWEIIREALSTSPGRARK